MVAKDKKTFELNEQFLHSGRLASLGELALDVAHDMSAPLTAAINYANFISDIVHDEAPDTLQTKNMLRRYSRQLKLALSLLENILFNLKSYGQDGQTEPFQSKSIKDIIHETLTLCHTRIKKHGTRLILPFVHISKSLEIECQAAQISQVLMNIVNNAIDAVEKLEDKWIRVEVMDKGDFIEMGVSNSGPQIAAELQEEIFESFFTTKKNGNNLGLGLSICKKIIEAHAGTIKLDCESAHTHFIVSLPKVVSQADLPEFYKADSS